MSGDEWQQYALQNRNAAIGQGDNLSNYLNNEVNYDQNLNDSYRGQADQAYSNLQQTPGYTDAQAAQIAGNPNAAFQYYDPNQLSTEAQRNTQNLGTQVSGYQSGLQGAAGTVAGNLNTAAQKGTAALNAVPAQELQYQGGVYNYLKGTNDAANGQYAANLNSAVNPANLTVSQDFANSYQLSPQEQQNIKNIAGTNVQGQYAKMSAQAAQQAAAQGNTSPAALAAIQEQEGRQGAIDAGTAMSQAELSANTEAAQRAQTLQSMQLSANQDLSSRQQANAGNLYSAQTGSANNLASMEQQGIQNASGNELTAASQGANLGYNAAQTGGQYGYQAADEGGQAGINSTQYSGSQELGVNQGNQSTGQSLATGADTAGSNRATTIGNQSITGQNNYRNYLTGEQGAAQQGGENSASTAVSNLGAEYGAANAAVGLGSANQTTNRGQTTSLTGNILGSLIGGASKNADMFEDGGVVTKPTIAIVGERGPEKVVSLAKERYPRYRMNQGERLAA